jgi:RNA polymerase sigma factor (sigma-70 family)
MRQTDLEQLYSRLEKPLYNVAYRWVWNEDEAREVVQETFVRLWRMRNRVEMKTVEPLIYRIAINLASSRRRSRRIWRWLSLDSLREVIAPEPSAGERLERSEDRARVREAVRSSFFASAAS